MNAAELFTEFLTRIKKDPRVSVVHIGMYAVLTNRCILKGHRYCCDLDRETLMGTAKISSPTTYYKIVGELAEYGYIRYEPSRNPRRRSAIAITTEQNLETINY